MIIPLFRLHVLFSQYRSCDNTLGNRFFQISFYSRAYLRIIYEKTMGQVPLGPFLGKQNIQLKRFIALIKFELIFRGKAVGGSETVRNI